jgi:hypothetical protein
MDRVHPTRQEPDRAMRSGPCKYGSPFRWDKQSHAQKEESLKLLSLGVKRNMSRKISEAHPSHATLLLCEWLAGTNTSYTALAASLGKNAITVYQWTKGTSRPRPEMWSRIEAVTGVPALAWTMPPKPPPDAVAPVA